MVDEQNTHLDEQTSDAGRSVSDDAVSNRSDDTALDESRASSTYRNGSGAEEPAQSVGEAAGEFEVASESPDVISDESSQESATAESLEADSADGSAYEQADDEPIESDEEPARPPAPPVEIAEETPEEIRMDWYILKVQSNRERSIAEALERKMRIEGLDRYFDQVIVPTEKVTEFKGGKKKIVERKLYPGYIVVHMHINDDTWFAVRETSGVGDFTGAGGKPTPMLAHEVSRIIQTEEEETAEAPKLDIKFSSGDKVKVKEGNFENFEGEVNTIDEASGRVTVMINIFGRSTPVELEYWQIEAV
jgi:transcription termination/antitermination protein NusG